RIAENFSGSTGSGLFSVSLMVFLSTTLVLAMAAYHDAKGLPVAGSIMRSTFHLASSAEKGWPLWNVTFGRRLNTSSVGEVYCHVVARAGWVFIVRGSILVKDSYTRRCRLLAEALFRVCGSKLIGSAISAQVRLPPRLTAAGATVGAATAEVGAIDAGVGAAGAAVGAAGAAVAAAGGVVGFGAGAGGATVGAA